MTKSTVKSPNIPSDFKRIDTTKHFAINTVKKTKKPAIEKNMFPKSSTLSQPKKRIVEEVTDNHWTIKRTTLRYKGW